MQDKAEFRAFLEVMRRRRSTLVRAVLICLCLAVGYLYTTSPVYEARAVVLVDQAEQNLLEADPLRNALPADNAYIESEAEILRSSAVALLVMDQAALLEDPDYQYKPGLVDRMANALGLKPLMPETETAARGRVLEEFQKNTSVQRKGLTYVINVVVKAGDPIRAAELANLRAQVYIDSQLRAKVDKRLFAQDVLKSQIATTLAMIEGSGSPLSRMNAQNKIETLSERLSDLETQASLQVPDSRIVASALPPNEPSSPKAFLVVAIALVCGGMLGLGVIYLNEAYSDAVTSAEQLSALVEAPMISAVPMLPRRFWPQVALVNHVVKRPLSPFSDAMRRVRAAVDQSFVPNPEGYGDGKIVLLTSSVPGEGKSTLALALARAFAQGGHRTLLIDADFRKPKIHRYSRVRSRVGLAEYLRRPDKYELPVVNDPKTELAMMLGKRDARQPTDDLVSSELFAAILASTRRSFDVVVVDSPPLMPAADARYLAREADAVLLVVKHASTNQTVLRSAADALKGSMRPDAALFTLLNQHRAFHPEYDYASYHRGAGFMPAPKSRGLRSANASSPSVTGRTSHQ